jgi:hypothetical protein
MLTGLSDGRPRSPLRVWPGNRMCWASMAISAEWMLVRSGLCADRVAVVDLSGMMTGRSPVISRSGRPVRLAAGKIRVPSRSSLAQGDGHFP